MNDSLHASTDTDSIPAVFKAKTKLRSSHIWLPDNGKEVLVEGIPRWQCQRCKWLPVSCHCVLPLSNVLRTGPNQSTAATFAMTTTKNALAHLRLKHCVGPDGIITAGAGSVHQRTIEKAFGQTRPRITFNIDVFKDLLLQWVVQMNVSFRVCEDTTFRSLCSYLAACQPDYSGVYRALPQSGNAIKRYVLTWYHAMKEDVMSQLHVTHTKIHFSFDMWSGPNRRVYQAIAAHWMARDGRLHAFLLSLHRSKGSHSGINQAEHLWRTITDYGTEPFVGMFNIDNAFNNDTALAALAEQLGAGGFPSFGPVSARLRCFGHVLNLAVKAILWGADIEAFGVDMNAAQDELAELLEWRKKGPMGKLHNILTYILKTPQRRDEFATVVHRLYPTETVHTVSSGISPAGRATMRVFSEHSAYVEQ